MKKKDIETLSRLQLESIRGIMRIDDMGICSIASYDPRGMSVDAVGDACLVPIFKEIEARKHVWSMWKKNTTGEYCCVIDSSRHIITTGKTPLEAALTALAAIVRGKK